MFEKFLAVLERIADAVEVIASSMTAGASAPRNETAATKGETAKVETTKKDDKPAETAAQKKAREKAEKAAADKAAKAEDPLGGGDDPLGGDAKKDYTEKEVREILAKLIDQDGRAAAFEVLKDKGGGAKAFTDLKKEHYEDVYVECQQRLG